MRDRRRGSESGDLGHACTLAPQHRGREDGMQLAGRNKAGQRIGPSVAATMAHRERGVLRVIVTGHAWLEATCRYKSVPNGGLRSLLVG